MAVVVSLLQHQLLQEWETLRPRDGSSSQAHSAQVDQVRQSKESNAGPRQPGPVSGSGPDPGGGGSDQISPCNVEPDLRQQQQQQRQSSDRAVSTQNPNASHHGPTQIPTFPCLCCHRGFQTCAQLLRHQQGSEPRIPHPHRHYQHHHHHCPLTSCLPCPQLSHPPQSPLPLPLPVLPAHFPDLRPAPEAPAGPRAAGGHVPAAPPACTAPPPSPDPPSSCSTSAPSTPPRRVASCAPSAAAPSTPTATCVSTSTCTRAPRPYSCADCGKSFSQSGALKIHRRIHTGERPYTCNFCGRGFPHLAGVRAHQRTHTGEKPYRCPQCGKCFTQSGALKIHLRIHTGERPFVCGLCGKGFSNRAGIRFHHRTVHGIVSEASLSLVAAASAHPGLSLLSSTIAGPPADPGLGLAVSPAASLSPDADGSPAGNPGADAGRPGSSLASGSSPARCPPLRPHSAWTLPLCPARTPPRGACLQAGRRSSCPTPARTAACAFRDAPSRNKHQELEHYPDPEDEEEEEEEGVGLSPEKEAGMGETVESMIQ
ncbi:hypothetical protein SKAU_G00417510 [Synaphobranchus kaupii]|uniref:C2H2-type domain-containing protein n=1 Tax=Synaphobranchus kaupii TaxID=118154 RepID=A0A9Q1E5Y7_SYNKA|nr:hypothetical protein SKAU_G00417510 [Synaphobranchus kaupii]